jgi:hypothetical protein
MFSRRIIIKNAIQPQLRRSKMTAASNVTGHSTDSFRKSLWVQRNNLGSHAQQAVSGGRSIAYQTQDGCTASATGQSKAAEQSTTFQNIEAKLSTYDISPYLSYYSH